MPRRAGLAYSGVVFNLGIAEIAVIVVVGLLIFGPDKLPKAIKSLSSGLRQFRSAASDATRSLQDAAGWDSTETRQTLSDLADLHPTRLMGSILEDPDASARSNGSRPGPAASATKPAGKEANAAPPPPDFDPDAP